MESPTNPQESNIYDELKLSTITKITIPLIVS